MRDKALMKIFNLRGIEESGQRRAGYIDLSPFLCYDYGGIITQRKWQTLIWSVKRKFLLLWSVGRMILKMIEILTGYLCMRKGAFP